MSDEPRKRPSPTSRARRIGGAAPRPGRPSADEAPATEPTTDSPADSTADSGKPVDANTPVDTSKPAPVRRPTPRPAPDAAGTDAQESGDESADDSDPRPDGGRGVPVRWLPAGVLSIAVVTLLVLVAVFSHGVYWAKESDSAGARTVAQGQLLAAAKKCFAQINTYDYRHLEGLTKADLACSTGAFTPSLRKALDKTVLRMAPRLHARQTAQVNKAGIASVSPGGGQAVVLIYGQLSQTNNTSAKHRPRVDIADVVVTVDLVKGSWLISRIDTDVPTS